MSLNYKFPDGFEWGTVAASYLVEGNWDVDGRGESIWNSYSRGDREV